MKSVESKEIKLVIILIVDRRLRKHVVMLSINNLVAKGKREKKNAVN
jgi:hypothetical protein